ncbi:hypothetical protein [Clostridium perfringens]|uniref:hypothetical protein n=1 Tax=Clostridium perfringens TaxID=1502 RepID=UPI000F51C02E|nr:hypothetical protein [Clostridium perfringens]
MENLTLDFNNFGSRVGLGTYEKCDSLTLTIMLDEKDYTGYKFKILAKKSDGHIIEQDIKEQDINREEKTIKTELNNQFTTKEGVVKLEINMVKEGKEDTTKEAFFIVRDTINGEVVESTSIIPTLEGVKVFIDEAVSSLGDLEQAGEEIALINGEFKEAEIKRKSSELLRERREKERVRLESIRTTEEADRIKAEAERKEAENNRKVAESNRKLNENTRKTNEAARVEAELNRQSLFEENEEIRNENEKLRIEAEKQRKLTFSNNNKFESERVEAEKLRTIAEDKRVTAEKARVKAEEERVKAETRRESTYTDFNDSEVERKNNEANRVRAEAERVNAESGRNELFNSNEEKRNNTFVESERARERAFNEAQTNRSEAYEESERVREEVFKVSEAARNEAEEVRKETELLRVEDENNRNIAESKRVEVESARVEAEKLRVAAESERVETENLRVTAEEERVAAEQIREEKFVGFENKIGANTKEIKGARTATTGENFDTLDERIDCEVGRLNKKIEVSMLQQNYKERHDINNTADGMTTDMIIKGRTLQNLWKPISIQWELTNKWFNALASSINFSITGKVVTVKNITGKTINFQFSKLDNNYDSQVVISSGETKVINVTSLQKFRGVIALESLGWENTEENKNKLKNGLIVCIGEYSCLPNIYFKGIKSFGQQEDKISILSSGKNLTNCKFELGIWNVSPTDQEPNKQSNSNYVRSSELIDISKFNDQQISISLNSKSAEGNIKYYTKDRKYIKDVFNAPFNPVPNAFYITIHVPLSSFSKYDEFQIETGSNSTSYEPYKCDKKDILLSELGFDEGLRGLLSVEDELNSNKKKAIKRIDKYKFTGEEEIYTEETIAENNMKFVIVTNRTGVKPSGSVISDNFIKGNDTVSNSVRLATNNKVAINIDKAKLSEPSVEGFKTWLKANPTTIYYELAEPIETPLDESIALKVYNEKTYVNFENSLKGTSSFKAPVNTTATIARLNRENRALEEENVKLKAGTYKNAEDITITNEELQATQSAVDFILFSNLNASESSVLYNGKKEGGGSMGAYLAMRIIKGKLKYDAVMKQYGEFKEDIDLILEAEGYGHLITQQ